MPVRRIEFIKAFRIGPTGKDDDKFSLFLFYNLSININKGGRISGKLASGGKKDYKGIVSTILLTVREEGASALYKGVTPTIIGALPYEGIKFGTVGLLDSLFPSSSSSLSPVVRKIIFGGLGGVAAGIITYPNDTVRRLMQLQGSRGTTTSYTGGYIDCVRKTYQTEGLSRFYRGATINIIRMAPNAAGEFILYYHQITTKNEKEKSHMNLVHRI